jgi:phosphatidylserine/phosphatidylglycerophosphate/cardiolipin synthase-like enzyme
VTQFAEEFWTKAWPGQREPDVYYYPRSLDLDATTGVLHAKGVVVDDEAVFVTSANFTEAALDRNIEVGMLSRDRTLAASLALHFHVLIERELLLPLPPT